jgi:hypothetical protein
MVDCGKGCNKGCGKPKCCCAKKKVAGKKRRGKVGKARLNASQIISMAPRAVPAIPLYTNNPLGEEQLTKQLTPVKKISVESIATQTEKDIEQVKPIFKRVNAEVQVPKSSTELPNIPNINRYRNQITPSMVSKSLEYKPNLGGNIPIRREGQYVVKETGLFAPDTRGAPLKEDTIAKAYGDIGRFFTKK